MFLRSIRLVSRARLLVVQAFRVRSLFGKYFVKTGQMSRELATLYNQLFDCRQESDYEDFFKAEESEVLPWLEEAEQFIDAVKSLLE
jgi:uncharacterized protein (UPF0332 family)